METKTKRVHVLMEPSTYKALRERAKHEGRSLSGHLVHCGRLELREAYLQRRAEEEHSRAAMGETP